jgi:hypothetical protein
MNHGMSDARLKGRTVDCASQTEVPHPTEYFCHDDQISFSLKVNVSFAKFFMHSLAV